MKKSNLVQAYASKCLELEEKRSSYAKELGKISEEIEELEQKLKQDDFITAHLKGNGIQFSTYDNKHTILRLNESGVFTLDQYDAPISYFMLDHDCEAQNDK